MKIHQEITRNYGVRAGEMAYQVKALEAKAHDLSSVSEITMVDGGNRLPQVGL